jgi:pimeloyl-ACP methyl ester carboxylesterase
MRAVPRARRDGVALFYEEAGTGDPSIVFVHGWTCDHSQFGPQMEHFSARHRTIAVDMRGHGRSDAVGPFDIPGYSDDVAWLCAALGLDRPVLVGHSMGGMIAVELASRSPELLGAVVALDSPFVAPGDLRRTVGPLLEALGGPDHLVARKEMAERSVGPYASPDLRDRVVATHCVPPQQVARDAFASLVGWDGASALAQVEVPVLCITAGMGGPGGHTDPSYLAAQCPRLFVGAVVGAGHFIQLEVSDQVNAMIERFLSIVGDHPETMFSRG